MRYKLILKEDAVKNLYFYHLAPKNINKIISLEYQYRTNKSLFKINSDKYRYRLCNGWNIYPGRDPNSLTLEEVHDGICKFRKSENGCNQIYMFRYPPFKMLGKNMANTLKNKGIYRIDLYQIFPLLNYVDWGYVMSNSDNKKLNKSYYLNVTPLKYFNNYDDNASMRFAAMNHISISPKMCYIPKEYFVSIPIPNTIEDIFKYEERR